MSDTNAITQWAFDTVAGRISAVDGQGRELMAITADPLFGPRLAAAFGWPMMSVGSWQQQMKPWLGAMTVPPRPAPMPQPLPVKDVPAFADEAALHA